MTMNSGRLPPYVERGNELVYRPPSTLDGARFYCFLVKSSVIHQSQLIDKYLNWPAIEAGTPIDFYAPENFPYVAFVFSMADSVNSTTMADRDLGQIPESEFAIWALAVDPTEFGVGWFIPYIFVGEPQAWAPGREIYGYAKQLAEITYETGSTNSLSANPVRQGFPDVMSLRAPSIVSNPSSPTGKAYRTMELVNIKRDGSSTDTTALPTWSDSIDMILSVSELLEELEDEQNGTVDLEHLLPHFGNRKIDPDRAATDAITGNESLSESVRSALRPLNLKTELLDDRVPSLNLKQIRDTSNPKMACYQAVTRALTSPVGFYGGGLLPDDYVVTVRETLNNPICRDYGLQSDASLAAAPDEDGVEQIATFKPLLSFWMSVDFGLSTGVVMADPLDDRAPGRLPTDFNWMQPDGCENGDR